MSISEELKQETKDKFELFLTMIEMTMRNTGVIMGWDKKQDKLVLMDVETKLTTRIDLEELNKFYFLKQTEREEKSNDN